MAEKKKPTEQDLLKQLIEIRKNKRQKASARLYALLPLFWFGCMVGALVLIMISTGGLNSDTSRNHRLPTRTPNQTRANSENQNQPTAVFDNATQEAYNQKSQEEIERAQTLKTTQEALQETEKELQQTKRAIENKMLTATAQAEYYQLMIIKNEAEIEIENLQHDQNISHTATAQALKQNATSTAESHEINIAILETKKRIEEDNLKTQTEKNDHDLERYDNTRNTIMTILLWGIGGIVFCLVLFVGAILKKAYKNQQWQIDKAEQERKQHEIEQTANAVSAILTREQSNKFLVLKLISAIDKIGGVDGITVPRFDKIKKHISQGERDQAVEILVKTGECNPVKWGVATTLTRGSFRDLYDDIQSGRWPPSSLVDQRLKQRYAQHLPTVNTPQQTSTVEKIADGVYRGN